MPKNSKKNQLNSWERQPGESEQAYEAFDCYLKMEKRSNAKVAAALGKSVQLMNRWSSRWQWVARVRDYENALKREEFEDAQKQIKAMQRRQLQTSVLVQRKAVEALDALDAEKMSAKDILNYITMGAELERQLREETINDAARESGQYGGGESLADVISNAYQKRQAEEEDDEEAEDD